MNTQTAKLTHYDAAHPLMTRCSVFLEKGGLTALQVLRTLLDPTGFDNVMDLLNNFPNAIVEFARYSIPVGVLARPTVIFEVREY